MNVDIDGTDKWIAYKYTDEEIENVEDKFSALYTNLWYYVVYVIDGQLDMNDSACVLRMAVASSSLPDHFSKRIVSYDFDKDLFE